VPTFAIEPNELAGTLNLLAETRTNGESKQPRKPAQPGSLPWPFVEPDVLD